MLKNESLEPGEADFSVHGDVARSLTRADLMVMVVMVAISGVVLILWSHLGDELIPVNNGVAYDSKTYAQITREPLASLFGGLDIHRVQRVVPSLVVFLMLAPFGLHTSTTALLLGFQVLNYTLIALTGVLWWATARRLGLSRPAGWIGFLALFMNYGLLKLSAYYPVLTDRPGFFLGMVLVWAVVAKKHALLPLIAVVGAFTWPTVAYSALGLYALSRPGGTLRPSRWWGVATAGALALGLTAVAVAVYRCGEGCASALMRAPVVPALLPLSLVVLLLWVYFATRPLLELVTIPNVLRAIDWRRLLIAAAVMLAIVVVQRSMADPSFRTVSRTLYNTALGGVVKPAGFLVAHSVFYGPAVLLLVLTWRRAVSALSTYGVGMVALVLGYVVLAITVEARILLNEWPFFVLLAAVVVDQLGWKARQAWIFAALSFVMSRVWFPVYHGEYTGDWRKFPDQFYGMSLGLKMTLTSYSVMAAASLGVGFVLLWLVRRPGREARVD
ncbi:MAG TPA: hypothetical protein VF012_03765 [Nocardioidaceae bacterium]